MAFRCGQQMHSKVDDRIQVLAQAGKMVPWSDIVSSPYYVGEKDLLRYFSSVVGSGETILSD